MEATFAFIALVFLSLCHESHQCFPKASKISEGGFPIYFPFSPTPSPSSQDFWGFDGSIFKAKSEYSIPRSVKIYWMNFMEGPKLRNSTDFKMITESNDVNEHNFKISMKMTAEAFDQSITMNPKMLELLELYSRERNLTTKEIEEIKKFRLAMGMVIGADFPGGSNQGEPSYGRPIAEFEYAWADRLMYGGGGFSWSVGPSGEKAMVDRFAVFYKNGTYDFRGFGVPACSWINQLPQGFSCGKASAPIQECHRRRNKYHEGFVPVPCDEIVLKVANKEKCPRYQIHYGPHDGGEYNKDEFDGEDCFAGTFWT